MTVSLEIGHEKYTVVDQKVTAVDSEDEAHVARAKHLTSIGPALVDNARHDGTLSSYDPSPDCTLAKIIAQHVHGRFECDPPPPLKPGVTY